MTYEEFLASKVQVSPSFGIDLAPGKTNPRLKPHQHACTEWLVRGGRRALFASFGLGKTVVQLETLRLILESVGGRGLITLPLGVRQEFKRDAIELLGWDTAPRFIRSIDEAAATGIYLTNYETVRDGKLDPGHFTVTSLDEAACLRAFGSSKTFREFMRLYESVPYRFVATATPSPNEYIELLAYAAYLGIMDVGQAKTRFFKRNPEKADELTLHPHKEREFWLWVASWALFLERPSDLGFDDEGYALPKLVLHVHEIPVDHTATVQAEKDGQGRMYREARHGVVDAAREKRHSLPARIKKVEQIIAESPLDHFVIWHDLEAERRALEETLPSIKSVCGSQDLDEREQVIIDFSDGKIDLMGAKPVIAGSGCNLQRHCHREIFAGVGFKFSEFIQALHRCYRFLQLHDVRIDIIYAESERSIYQNLMEKWERHKEQAARMREIVREYGMLQASLAAEMRRSMGVERVEASGDDFVAANNDSVFETRLIEANTVGLILTSIPFSTQYEYTPSYNDFGHSESNEQFFEQMDYLTPELLRVLMPGRIAAIHVKDRIVPGGMTGLGFQTVYPFHCRTIDHYVKHGFAYLGMKTIVTDVVRENNQTYRLGWTEQCKDGSKMGCGMPEYLLLFRKPPTDSSNGYADAPIVKSKKEYSRSRWQIDAHGFARSSGNRLLTPSELDGLQHHAIFKRFREHSLGHVYDHGGHVALSEHLEACSECGHIHTGRKTCGKCPCSVSASLLPKKFMLLQPQSWQEDVWTDITRMLTLNGAQSAKGREIHLCPMQFDLADRVIIQNSMPGEIVYDPFAGLFTVPYRAVILGRYGRGVELGPEYFGDGIRYLRQAEQQVNAPTLFEALEVSHAG